jgi:hypothetical protein
MELISVATLNNDLGLKPMGDRYYSLTNDIDVKLEFTGGLTYIYHFNKNFITNFRSGAPIIDVFTDQIGDTLQALAYLIHDANYTPCHYLFNEHPLSKKESDKLLYQMLVYSGFNKVKANIIYKAVNIFGKSAYYDDDKLTAKNKLAFSFYRKVIV